MTCVSVSVAVAQRAHTSNSTTGPCTAEGPARYRGTDAPPTPDTKGGLDATHTDPGASGAAGDEPRSLAIFRDRGPQQSANRRRRRFLETADLHVPQPLPVPFEEMPRVGLFRAPVEPQVDVSGVSRDVADILAARVAGHLPFDRLPKFGCFASHPVPKESSDRRNVGIHVLEDPIDPGVRRSRALRRRHIRVDGRNRQRGSLFARLRRPQRRTRSSHAWSSRRPSGDDDASGFSSSGALPLSA